HNRALPAFPTRRSSDLSGKTSIGISFRRWAPKYVRPRPSATMIKRKRRLVPTTHRIMTLLPPNCYSPFTPTSVPYSSGTPTVTRSEEHTSELQSPDHLL